MSHARIEEVSDSDPDIDDPSDYLADNDNAIIRRADQPSTTATSSSSTQQPQSQPRFEPTNPTLFRPPPPGTNEVSREAIKHFCTIYPCYFSSSRTRSQGRRVAKSLASPNPLAYNLLPALRHVCAKYPQINVAFEPDKTHPKDWANPGRMRVQLFDQETHAPLAKDIPNKEHLFNLMAQYMKDHPTQPEDAVAMKIPGLPVPDNFTEMKTQKPRGKGWAIMNDVLPLHSAAVSGGGVKDDFFKEAMEEMKQMQAAQGGGAGGAPGGMDMGALQQMMQGMGGMGGMGGLGGMLGGGGGGSGRDSGRASPSVGEGSKKKKDKKK